MIGWFGRFPQEGGAEQGLSVLCGPTPLPCSDGGVRQLALLGA
jgi:hypothetical protein